MVQRTPPLISHNWNKFGRLAGYSLAAHFRKRSIQLVEHAHQCGCVRHSLIFELEAIDSLRGRTLPARSHRRAFSASRVSPLTRCKRRLEKAVNLDTLLKIPRSAVPCRRMPARDPSASRNHCLQSNLNPPQKTKTCRTGW